MRYLLALDAGTSSLRGGICDEAGRLVFLHQVRYRVRAAQDGRVEQDPGDFQNALEEAAQAAGAYCRERGLRLSGVGLASQRSSLIAVDGQGAPLRDAIMWQDKRAQSICDQVNAGHDPYFICGMRATPVFTGPKILWLRRNEPETYQRTHKFLGVHEFLLHRMTGKFVTDASVASRSCMMDLRAGDWSEELLATFGARREHMSEIFPAGSVCGFTTPEFTALLGQHSPIPVISAGGDQQCATLGLGITRAGELSVNCGTGAYVATLAGEPAFDPQRNVICNAAAIDGKYVLEASTLASGMAYDWLVGQIYRSQDYREADREAASSPPGAGGVVALPDLMGRGMPSWDSNARGAFYNIGFHTTRGDLSRAMLEGLAAELRGCVGLLESLGVRGKRVICSGGLSKSPLFDQIQADMYQLPVLVSKNCEATLRGVWAGTAAALEWYPDAAAAVENGDCGQGGLEYLPSPAAGEAYRRVNRAREMLYGAFDTKRLRSLTERFMDNGV